MNQSDKYNYDRQFSDTYLEQVTRILKQNAMHIVSVEIASNDQDTRHATDMLITVSGGCVAVRTRRTDCGFRDWTIRSQAFFGGRTELHKLKAGYADWYLYGWTKDNQIVEWMLIDLKQVRKSKLLDKSRKEISNNDGTAFVSVSLSELLKHDCIVTSEL